MTISKLLSAAALMLSAFAATPAAATIVITQSGLTTYDTLETFQTPFLGNNATVTTQFAGLTFAATGNGGVRYNSCGTNAWDHGSSLSGATLNTYGPGCQTNGTDDGFTITFDSAVTAVSLGVSMFGSSSGRSWQAYLGSTLIETYQAGAVTGFLNVSGYTFDRLRFNEGTSASSYMVFDNLARVDAVPEPAALGLLGLGVLGLALRRRKTA